MITLRISLVALPLALCGLLGYAISPSRAIFSDERAIPFYTGSVYPSPREAVYRDAFLSLDRSALWLGEGIASDDGRVALLIERIERYGGRVDLAEGTDAPGDTLILFGETGAFGDLLGGRRPPERAEGFLLHAARQDGRNIVFLKGHDFLGLLWAVNAFNQLVTIEDGRTVVRSATLLDYPAAPGKRAYTAMNDNESLDNTWFAVHCLRPNVVIYRMARQMFGRHRGTWREDYVTHGDAWRAKVDRVGAMLNPLGIEWYDSILPNHSTDERDPEKNRQIRSNAEEDFRILRDMAMCLAERGGNLGLLYDDFRFPIHPDDERDFGSAREADIYFINKLYDAVAAEYPNFKILFCPPFYWGPGSDASAAYGESRDEYLRAIGERLPEAVEIYWSGPRVKSTTIRRDDVRWITDKLQRKPVLWQNIPGVYHGSPYYVYPTDSLSGWRDWYDDGFLDDISFYTQNAAYPLLNLVLFDALWNRSAYDPEASMAEAGRKLVGLDAYPDYLKAYRMLEELDHYGWFSPTALAARNVDEVREKTEALVAFFEQAPAPLRLQWAQLGMFVGYRKGYLQNLLENPQLKEITAASERVRELAVRETGMDPDAEDYIVLTPHDFNVALAPRYYAWRGSERRFAVWIYGARSAAPAMDASFDLPYPLTGDSELIIAGLDHNAEPPCRIRILVNGNTVFEGENPFQQDRWTTHSFRVRGAFLRDGVLNTLRIENLEDSDVMTFAPWFMLNYVVLRQAN